MRRDIFLEEAAAALVTVLSAEIINRKLDNKAPIEFGPIYSASPLHGANYQNDRFSIMTQTSHDAAKGAGSLDKPFFEHYETGLRSWWYRRIDLGFRVEAPQDIDLADVLADCLKSLY